MNVFEIKRRELAGMLAAALTALLATATLGAERISVAGLKALDENAYRVGARYELEARVVGVKENSCIVEQDGERIFMYCTGLGGALSEGDRARMTVQAVIADNRQRVFFVKGAFVLSHEEPPPPEEKPFHEIVRGRHDYHYVRLTGRIVGVEADDIDPRNSFLILSDGEDIIEIAYDTSSGPGALVGAKIEVIGMVAPVVTGWRVFHDRIITRFGRKDFLRILEPAPADPFAVPVLGESMSLSPRILTASGRRRFQGEVLAVWHGDRMMLTDGGRGPWSIVQAELGTGEPLPRCGESVEVVGLPSTDMFTVTLGQARWRKSSVTRKTAMPSASEVTASEMLRDKEGNHRVKANMNGRLLKMSGTVRSIPVENRRDAPMNLQCGEYLVSVDLSGFDEPVEAEVGSEVEVTGICCILAGRWQDMVRVPRVSGFRLVPRSAADIRVVRRPPWWTPGRLLVLMLVLMIVFAAVIAWNRTLNRLLAKRKVAERTGLAAELHDTISQYLYCVAVNVQGAEAKLKAEPSSAAGYLHTAAVTLSSCREELRRCLWDLRNDVLGADDFSKALADAISPLIGSVTLKVRFRRIDRRGLSDMLAHAVVSISRELAVNAVRHGHASHVFIAGEKKDGYLRFQVHDDGAGFDPDSVEGPGQGHFGLTGVRERVNRFAGTIRIESRPGGGALVRVELKI